MLIQFHSGYFYLFIYFYFIYFYYYFFIYFYFYFYLFFILNFKREICDFNEKRGFGDKKILREVGRIIGFQESFYNKKKAAIHHGKKKLNKLTNKQINNNKSIQRF